MLPSEEVIDKDNSMARVSRERLRSCANDFETQAWIRQVDASNIGFGFSNGRAGAKEGRTFGIGKHVTP